MEKHGFKKIAMRIFSVLLAGFSIVFGATWKHHDVCLGDRIFNSLGIPAWSNGTEGTHYAGIVAVILFIIACFLFAATTKEKGKTFRILMIGVICIVIVSSFLSVLI
ncbi:MAG: hypothetical protein Q4B90_04800 [Eubacteriales bacterium]|nr:hypothetical protein [Eubacteriales bacterium]